MSVISAFTAGTFTFPGYCSRDAEATKKFYSGLLGWDAEDTPMGDMTVTTFKVGDVAVSGMYELPENRKQAGVKPHWNSYIAVDNVKETVSKALAMGAKRLGGPEDVSEDDMENLEDPTGVRFTLISTGNSEMPPESRINETGALCWNELCTRDAATSVKFYAETLGWTPTEFEGGQMPYTIFTMPGHEKGVAGMLEITKEMEGCVAPQWLPYFQVEDADATAARANELGGKAQEPMDIPNVGRIVYINDNQGAAVAVIQVAMQGNS